MTFLEIIKLKWAGRSSASLIKYYREKGIKIGENCTFRSPRTTQIDIMRPALITIGDNVDMNKNFTIMSHDFSHWVFRNKYGEFLSSSGRVTIGSNIYFGINVTVLKGVTIGDNCVIGAGSVVTKDIPSNSVAVGVPCRVLCSIDDYYKKRKKEWVEEAKDYAVAIRERFNREPVIDDFRLEFGIYTDSSCLDEANVNFIRQRLGDKYDIWLKNHKAEYKGFNEFIEATNV